MNNNKQLIEYGNEFLNLFRKKFENDISLRPLITFLIDNDKKRAEMKLDVKIDNGNIEKLKDIQIIIENQNIRKIREILEKRHGDYYTASIFKDIKEFTKEEVEKDFKQICNFNFFREESKEDIFFKTDYNDLSEEDKFFYDLAKEQIEAGAIDDLEEFNLLSEEQKDITIKTWALELKNEKEEENKKFISNLKSLAKEYGFQVKETKKNIVLLVQNTDKEDVNWIWKEKLSGNIHILGNTDQCNIWFTDTRKDLTAEKIIEFVDDLNSIFHLDKEEKILISELIDPEDWQELANIDDAYKDQRFIEGLNENKEEEEDCL